MGDKLKRAEIEMNIKHEHLLILSGLIKSHGFDFVDFLENFGTDKFPEWKIGLLCDWINEEFMKNGLLDNFEPNKYGIVLENILDYNNRYRISVCKNNP